MFWKIGRKNKQFKKSKMSCYFWHKTDVEKLGYPSTHLKLIGELFNEQVRNWSLVVGADVLDQLVMKGREKEEKK